MTNVDATGWIERARARMRDLGITQQELGEGIGALPARVSHYFTARREPSLAQFMLIARYLQVTTDWLLFGGAADPIKPPPPQRPARADALADQIARLDPASRRDVEGYIRVRLAQAEHD